MANTAAIRVAAAVLVAAAVGIGGCATTSHTEPSKVSIGDLYSDRLAEYIASRRIDLARLELNSNEASARLATAHEKLTGIERDLSRARTVEFREQKELDRVRGQIRQARNMLDREKRRGAKLDKDIEGLEGDLLELESKRDAQYLIASKEIELQELEREIALLERTIEQTVIARAKHGATTR